MVSDAAARASTFSTRSYLILSSAPFTLANSEDDLARIRELVRRYADLPRGLADATVIACAERHGGKLLTLDQRHVGVVARDGTNRNYFEHDTDALHEQKSWAAPVACNAPEERTC